MRGTSILWLKYYKNGVAVRESSGFTERKKAERLLRKRLGEISEGTYIGPNLERVLVSELADDMLRDYRTNARKSIGDLEARWKLHLKPFFGNMRAVEVTSSLVAKYVDLRQEEGAQNGTCNRELAALKRMFTLALRSSKVKAVPYIAMLAENNVRTGFLETSQHVKLAAECGKIGLWLRAIFEVGYTFGWRHEEVVSMRVRQVDFLANTIRLDPGTTKNNDGREVTMTQPVRELLIQSMIGKKPDDCLFSRANGNSVSDFRGSWAKACKGAGVSGLLFHDLRRTAVRNMVLAGIPERVAMKISGHKTRSIFDRYHIVSQSDIAEAMQKLEVEQHRVNALAAQSSEFGQSFGQSDQKTRTSNATVSPTLTVAN
jgi:integrase